MTAPSDGWVIDCGHWHCPDRLELRHAHHVKPEDCSECAEERKPSERARALEERARKIAEKETP